MISFAEVVPERVAAWEPAGMTSHLNESPLPSHVKVGEVSCVGPTGPPVIDGAGGTVGSIVNWRTPPEVMFPALSTTRTRQSISTFSGSGGGVSPAERPSPRLAVCSEPTMPWGATEASVSNVPSELSPRRNWTRKRETPETSLPIADENHRNVGSSGTRLRGAISSADVGATESYLNAGSEPVPTLPAASCDWSERDPAANAPCSPVHGTVQSAAEIPPASTQVENVNVSGLRYQPSALIVPPGVAPSSVGGVRSTTAWAVDQSLTWPSLWSARTRKKTVPSVPPSTAPLWTPGPTVPAGSVPASGTCPAW